MIRYQFKKLTIEVLDEPSYKYDSTDNIFNYSKNHIGAGAQAYPTSKHGVKIYRDDQIINSCIIIGSGGATGVHQNSSLVDNDQFLICCCDTIFCLSLSDLELKWKTQADQATCFEIFKFQSDYIVHGEIEISRLDKDGNIKWQFGGSDIFVSIDNGDAFTLKADHIALKDFNNIKYKIDFDGKIILSSHEQTEKTTVNNR